VNPQRPKPHANITINIYKSNTANISINGCIKTKETSVKMIFKILKIKIEIAKKPLVKHDLY